MLKRIGWHRMKMITVKKIVRMIKKPTVLILCVIILLSFVCCGKDTYVIKDIEPVDGFIFDTENITKITFYGYYGQGKGSVVSDDNMEEITEWLETFALGEIAYELLPGVNTYYVEIEYSDGTKVREGLNVVIVDGIRYYTECTEPPVCFDDIISGISW